MEQVTLFGSLDGKTCAYCGAAFYRRPSQCNRDYNRQRFCGKRCVVASKTKNDGTEKPCNRCLAVKPLGEFYQCERRGNGERRVAALCKPCWAMVEKQRRDADPERTRKMARQYNAAWREKNIDRERVRGRESQKRRRERRKALGIDKGAASRDNRGGVYFLRSGDAGPIKIGWAKHSPRNRIGSIQIGNPEPVRFLGLIPGATILDETKLHDRFWHLRVRGEWFRPEPELLEFIANNTQAPADGKAETAKEGRSVEAERLG